MRLAHPAAKASHKTLTMSEPRILLYDIETAPNLVRTWGVYEQNALEVIEDWHLLSFAYKWADKKTARVLALPDFPLYKREPKNDRELAKRLWSLFNEADMIVAHHGDAFDYKKAQARFLVHGLAPHSPVAKIDTKKLAKRNFGFASNRLDELGRQLGLGRKEQTGGYALWRDCLAGCPKAWARMKRYNKQDVILLESVWRKLSPFSDNQPNRNVYLGQGPHNCPRPACGGTMQKDGFRYTQTHRYQQFRCGTCGAYARGGKLLPTVIR